MSTDAAMSSRSEHCETANSLQQSYERRSSIVRLQSPQQNDPSALFAMDWTEGSTDFHTRFSPSALNTPVPTMSNTSTENHSHQWGTLQPRPAGDNPRAPYIPPSYLGAAATDHRTLEHNTDHPAHVAPSNTMDPSASRINTSQADVQIEHIASWSDISYFISLYLRYMHSLLPLVHKPSFCEAISLRTDQSDSQFRALVLGLGEYLSLPSITDQTVAYTIGQSPLSRTETRFARDHLEQLQRRCYRASMTLLDKNYQHPSLSQIGILITYVFQSFQRSQLNVVGAISAHSLLVNTVVRPCYLHKLAS